MLPVVVFVFPVRVLALPMLVLPVFMFDGVDIGVATGVGLVMLVLVLRFALFDALFEPVSPHAAPKAPIAKTAVSAIFFIILL
jgi:hypothetical protein